MSWTFYANLAGLMAESEESKRRKLRLQMKRRKNKPSTVKKYICFQSAPQWKKYKKKRRNSKMKGYWYSTVTYLHRDGTEKHKPYILAIREKKGKKPPLIVKKRDKKGKVLSEKRLPICKPKKDKSKKSFAYYAEMANTREYVCATPLAWKTRNGKGCWSCTLKFRRLDGTTGTAPHIQSRNSQVKPRHVTIDGARLPFCT